MRAGHEEERADPAPAADGSEPVVLVVTHDRATVPAAAAPLVASALAAGTTVFSPGGPRGHGRHRARECFYRANGDGGLRIPPGLVERAVGLLRARGVVALVDDRRRYGERQQPDLRVPAQSRPDLVPFLAAAAERPRGTDVWVRRDELADRVAALCRLHPAASIAILEPNADLVEDRYRRLVARAGGPVFRGNEDFWRTRPRRVVLLAQKLPVLSPDDFDLLLAADALSVAARGNWSSLSRQWGLKAYGFLPVDRALSDRERLRVEAVFGPPLVPTPGHPRVAVHMSISPWAAAPPVSADPLARKRTALWRAAARSGHVAAVAAAARACDAAALAELGLGRLAEELAARRDRGPRVAVLVESPEHGRHVLARLPGWRLVRRDVRPHRAGWGGWDAAAPLRDPDGFDGCVLTTLAARQIEALDVDVLVRADGAAGPLRLPGFPAPDREPDRAQVVVDVADDFDNAAVEDTRSRLRAYGEAGWQIRAAPRLATAE